MTSAAQRLTDVLARCLDICPGAITENTEIAALEADALELADVVLTAEQEFGCVLSDQDVEEARTVGQLARAFERRSLSLTAGEGEA